MGERESIACVAEDHPSLSGHFPGHPLVPGVVILQHVQAALEADRRGCRIAGLTRVKFIRTLRPGQPFVVSLEWRSADRVAFVCLCDGEAIARGQLLTTDASGERPL